MTQLGRGQYQRFCRRWFLSEMGARGTSRRPAMEVIESEGTVNPLDQWKRARSSLRLWHEALRLVMEVKRELDRMSRLASQFELPTGDSGPEPLIDARLAEALRVPPCYLDLPCCPCEHRRPGVDGSSVGLCRGGREEADGAVPGPARPAPERCSS